MSVVKEGWTYKYLYEVCDKGSSNIVINKLDGNDGDYPLYGANGLVKKIDFFHQEKPYLGIVKDGAGVGRVNIYPAFSSLVGTMQYIYAKKDCLLEYIKYFLVKLDLSHCVSGATIPHIYFKDYGKERIPVPPLSTQQSIVSELDKINELIALKKSQLKDLDSLAQSIFYEMFGDPFYNEKKWQCKKINDVSIFINGLAHEKDIDPDGDYILVNSKFISSNGSIYKKSKIQRMPLYENDIAMVMSDLPNGKALAKCMIIKANGLYTLNQRICVFRDYSLIPLFLLYTLNRNKYYLRFDDGNGQTNLRKNDVINCPVILPPISLQHQFAERVESIERMKLQVQTAIKDLETFLASRMQYWFD